MGMADLVPGMDDTQQRARVADAHLCLCIRAEPDGNAHTRATSGITKTELCRRARTPDRSVLLRADELPKQQSIYRTRCGDEAATRACEHARPVYASRGRSARAAALLSDR